MAFPVAPTNGQTAVVNNITYQFSNVGNTWTRIQSAANLITANVITANVLNINNAFAAPSFSTTGNVTGLYFLGNGALLTGVTASVANINSGNSNVSVVSAGGNIAVGIGGTANVVVFAAAGEYITGVLSASGNITGGNLSTAGSISATGTLSITGNTTVTTISAGNVSAGNVITGGIVSATGNVTGGNLSGTSIAGTLTTTSQTNITSVGTLGLLAVTANITGGNLLTGGLISAVGNITGTSHLGAVVSVTGNITGGNLLTGGVISAVGNITGTSHLGAVVSVTGNITGGNILTSGVISATGNITTAADVTAQNVNSLSDAVLKDNINQLNDTRSVINQLFGVEYDWKNGTGHSYGLIAQDVEKVLPSAVKTNDAGLKSVNYNMIIPFLIETIKHLGSEVDELKKKINT
jgi:hypothetical protein